MKKEAKEILRMLALAMLAMLALPAGYRLWLRYHPQPERKPFSAILQEASIARREALLRTPVDRWTAEDAKLAPDLHAWLADHASVVLPWEWTAEAVRKDPEGHRVVWVKILKEQLSRLEDRLSRKQKLCKAAEEDARNEHLLFAHLTNQVSRIDMSPTNVFPRCIEVDEMTKGRFWGWNHRNQRKSCETAAELQAYVKGLESDAAAHASRRESAERTASALKAEIAELQRMAEETDSVRAEPDEVRGNACLLKSIPLIFRP